MSKHRVFRRRPKTASEPLPELPQAPSAPPQPTESDLSTPAPTRDEPALDTQGLEDLASMSMEDFAAAMDGIVPTARGQRYSPGDAVSGVVVRVGAHDLFVDLGGKSEATLSREEAPDAQRGDRVEAFVLRAGDELRLCKKLSARHATEGLEAALESGIPMDGRVTERNTGGFVVELGGARAFCPVSQIDHRPQGDLDAYVGQTLAFKVLELRGRDVVVGRREIAAEEAAHRTEELWATLKPGAVLEGTVASIQDYGAFIELGGIQGLAHKSELSWDRRAKTADLVELGQKVSVRVITVDRGANKVGLGLVDKLGEPGEGQQAQPRSARTQPKGGMGTFAAAFAKAKKG